jgi:hypothetical protein
MWLDSDLHTLDRTPGEVNPPDYGVVVGFDNPVLNE